jgi:hypothetical protein
VTKKTDLKKQILRDIRETREVINQMERYARGGNPQHMAMVATFFHVLRHHMTLGDLTPENIDLYLNIKHQEFLRTQGETI